MDIKRLCVGMIFLCGVHTIGAQKNDWAWVYKKVFTQMQMNKNGGRKSLIFEKNTIPHFSQLIFSWNARKPKKGFFTFYVQSRKSDSGGWSKWHKMASWGADIQKSHYNACGVAKYIYVRLETGLKRLGNAFRIKIVANDGASLALLKSFAVCTSNFAKFKNEFIGTKIKSLKSVHIRHVPKISQRVLNHPHPLFLCSPTSCSMLARFFTKRTIDPVVFAYSVFDNGGLKAYGSWPFNMASLFEVCGGKLLCYTARMNSFTQLHNKLCVGVPVAVSVRGYIKGAPKPYRAGHFLVVTGWDAKRKKVICHDPAFFSHKGTLVRYDVDSFLRAWERSHRLAYVVEPLGRAYKKV